MYPPTSPPWARNSVTTCWFRLLWSCSGMISDALLRRGVGHSAEILLEDLGTPLAGIGVHEQCDGRAQLLRVDGAEDLLGGAAAGAAGVCQDGGVLGQPSWAENPSPGRPGPPPRGDGVPPCGRAYPRPDCGKINHIQWLALRPARS